MNEEIQITPGESSPDALRYRASGIKLWAQVGDNYYNLTDVQLTNQLGKLPECNISLAVGAPATNDAQNTSPVTGNEFKRYQAVKLILNVTTPDSGEDVGEALAAGEYEIFDGYVINVSTVRSADAGVSITLRCIHYFGVLTAGTSLFSPLIPHSLVDMQTAIRGTFSANKEYIRSEQPFWTGLLDTINDIFFNPANRSQFSGKAVEELDADLNEFGDGLEAARELLNGSDIISLLDYRIPLTDLKTTLAAAEILIQSTGSDPNLWNALGKVLMSYQAVPICTAKNIQLVPYWPCAPSQNTKRAPAGVTTLVRSTLNEDTTFRVLPIASLVVHSVAGTFTAAEQNDAASPIGSYKADPGYDSRFTGIQVVPAPHWLSPRGASTAAQKIVQPTTGSAPDENTDTTEEVNYTRVGNPYARFATYQAMFSGASMSVNLPFRLDLLPGQNFAFDLYAEELDQTFVYYGCIAGITLSIRPGEATAMTTLSLSHVRTQDEQENIVDAGESIHHLWNDRTADLSKLRWA